MVLKASGLPDWLKFDAARRRFTGTPPTYSTSVITITASDSWNGTANMTFTVIAGIRPNQSPKVVNKVGNTAAYRGRLFYYKLPDEVFTDDDGDTLYYLLSQTNGDTLPNWLAYEDITRTLSGFTHENATRMDVIIIADDRRGGSANTTFSIDIQLYEELGQDFLALAIVCLLLVAFIVGIILVICKKNLKCCRRKRNSTQEPNSDSDSYEEDDDICIEDARPKNPFQFKKEIEDATNNDEKLKNERFKYYGARVPQHARAKVKRIDVSDD